MTDLIEERQIKLADLSSLVRVRFRYSLPRIICHFYPALQEVRVHHNIVMKLGQCAKLWYALRAADQKGQGGLLIASQHELCQLFRISSSTLQEWKREGLKKGAFRSFKIRRGICYIWMGGLKKVSLQLGLINEDLWGTCVTVPLRDVIDRIKPVAVAALTQELQQRSQVAAWRGLNKQEREFYRIPDVYEIMSREKVSSPKPQRGAIPFLYHVGPQKIFVGKGFIPYGTAQETIAYNSYRTPRTIRSYFKTLGTKKRQLVQTKEAYAFIEVGIELSPDNPLAEPNIWYQEMRNSQLVLYNKYVGYLPEDLVLYEPNGLTSSKKPTGHTIKRSKFFRYRKKTWIYRCNLYLLDYEISSMKEARYRYKIWVKKQLAKGEKEMNKD